MGQVIPLRPQDAALNALGKSWSDQIVAAAKLQIVAHLGDGECRFSRIHFEFRESRRHVPMALFYRATAELIVEGIIFADGAKLQAETRLSLEDYFPEMENPFHE